MKISQLLKTPLIFLALLSVSFAEVIEVFEDKDGLLPPKSGKYLWTAKPGILSKDGKSVIQTDPNPKTMRLEVVHDISSGKLTLSGDGETMVMMPLASETELPWRGDKKTKALSALDIALVAGKDKAEDLPCWTGKHTNKEGVKVSYSLIQVMDNLFIGEMTGSRGTMTFHRSFLLAPVKK